ncbi:MAG: hypothetical protein V1929_01500 [bacterium]
MIGRIITLVIVVALQVALRFTFQSVPVVPHYIDFNPGIALVPAAGCFLGLAGAIASMVANLASDYLQDMWSALALFRALGVFFFAMSASALWPIARKAGWMGYVVVNLIGCFAAASWSGLGADLTRTYPFAYVSTIVLLHHGLFCLIAGPGLYLAARNRIDVPERDWGLRASWWVVSGAVGSWIMGIFVSGTFYRNWPFEQYHLSDFSGMGLVVYIVPLLLLNLLGSARLGRMIN